MCFPLFEYQNGDSCSIVIIFQSFLFHFICYFSRKIKKMRNDGLAFAGLHGRVVDVCSAGSDELLHPAPAHEKEATHK